MRGQLFVIECLRQEVIRLEKENASLKRARPFDYLEHFKITEAELRTLFVRMNKKIKDGVWTGALADGRPVLYMVTEHSRTRPKMKGKPYKGQVRFEAARTKFLVYALRLLEANIFPSNSEETNVSHLCHNPKCIRADHLEWSTRRKNSNRNLCGFRGSCMCGFTPACIFSCQ